MKAFDIARLIEAHGDIKLSELMLKILGDRKHICPQCNARGVTQQKYNAYPSCLPDSGWVDDLKCKDVSCDLCQGYGYTVKKYVPKMVQQGWESK